MDRDEAQRILDELKPKRDTAVKNRDVSVKEAEGVDMYLEPEKYEKILSKILTCDEFIKTLDARIGEAEERLAR